MKRNHLVLILILVLALIGQAVWIVSLKTGEPETQINTSTVLESMKDLGELNTLEMYFHDIIEYTESKTFRDIVIPFSTKSFIFTVEARVKAGVNLNNIDPQLIIIDGQSITITMPEYEITSIEYLKYNPFSENDALFNKIRNDDFVKALDEFKVNLTAKAQELGIVEQAEKNGRLLIHNILSNLGFTDITIK